VVELDGSHWTGEPESIRPAPLDLAPCRGPGSAAAREQERRVVGRHHHAIAADGSLSNRRVWADLDGGFPDGICLDADNAVWYGDVPNQRCVRVREGGEVLQTIDLDRGG
jgi:sugar lactone lactonase YvrE